MGKKSNKTTNKTIYGNTTTTNPYVTSKTDNEGTVSVFNKGNAFDTVNNFVNKNMGNLLDQYLNPSLNTTTNQSKMNSYINTLNAETSKNLENNIINPLSNRNMLRSSQATNLYNNLANSNASNIAGYTNELLSTSQADTAKVLSNLMLQYMNAYSALANNQQQSLATSQGNASRSQEGSGGGVDSSQLLQIAATMALQAMSS